MINLLGIGLDYLMLQDSKVRGDVRRRQSDYAARLNTLTLVVYSPKELGLKPQQWADNLWVYPTNSLNKAMFVKDALRLTSELSRGRGFDAITTEDPFTTGLIGSLLKRKLKIPLNVQVHNDFCDNRYWIKVRPINWFFNLLGKFNLRHADTIRIGTNYERSKLSETLKIGKDKIHVIPVNSEIDHFEKANGANIRKRYINDRYDRMLLFTGRLVEQKGLPALLKAFKIVIEKRPNTLLLIVGKGPKETLLKSMAKELGLQDNIVFTGSIDHKEIPGYVAACDIYTISSLFEGTCIAMAEAMAAGKPVVATKFAGAHDLIVDGKTGFKVEQGDYKNFAERVIYLLGNPQKAKEIGSNASAFIKERFANNKNIDEVIKLWEKTAATT